MMDTNFLTLNDDGPDHQQRQATSSHVSVKRKQAQPEQSLPPSEEVFKAQKYLSVKALSSSGPYELQRGAH
jgi:hypothetical protein